MVSDSSHSAALLTGIVSTPAMDRIFCDENQVQQMVRFEAALAVALAECGLAAVNAAAPLEALLADEFLTSERADVIRAAASSAGNIAIPFVKLLTAAVAERDPAAAACVHLGATSQDVLDTALCLQMKEALPLLQADLSALIEIGATLAKTHALTLMAGRTWLQQGPPTTLGLKAAGWTAALARQRERLGHAASGVRLQFGGAVGTLASLGDKGLMVSAALSHRLELPESPSPWHGHRDGLAEVACSLGNLIGTLGKIARDLSLLMQTEVAEAFEPSAPGKGGSSTMPHKRNPVASAAVLAAATRAPGLVATILAAMPQEHERGLGGWQAEWEVLPQLFRLTGSALAHMTQALDGVEVHPERMAANLAATHGLVLAEAVSTALTPHVGREQAHHLLEQAARAASAANRPLLEVLRETPEVTAQLDDATLQRLLDPANYLGSTAGFIQRALDATKEHDATKERA